jgi:molybdopterin molybdotransferase
MITIEEALEIVLNQTITLSTEYIDLKSSMGRVLARDVCSDSDMPPFDKTAVDGYACRFSDLSAAGGDNGLPDRKRLRCLETIPAGKIPEKHVSSGSCSRIMTGAMIPEGADCVVMVEETEISGDDWILFNTSSTARNICFKGEDIKAGDTILERGTVIKPAHAAVLAGSGTILPMVYMPPTVGIISTGDELTEPWERPGPGKIRNSNASQLEAQVRMVPATPQYHGIAPDDPENLKTILLKALEINDLILLTGGVSMGDFDFVPSIMKEAGIEILFEKIAVQPGKPTVFGRKGGKYIFGLPGNPVSSYILFELLVRPFILKMTGNSYQPRDLALPMGVDFSRRKSVRKTLIPVQIRNGQIFPVSYHGSAHINAYTLADAVMIIEIGKTEIKSGELVHVRLL